MESCLNTKSLKIRRVLVWILAVFFLCFFTGVAIVWYADYPETGDLLLPSLVLIFGIGTFCFFAFGNIIDSRKYAADQKGITISYICGYKKFYPWHVFPKIVVCDYDHAGKYPENIDSWRGYFYTTFRNSQKILCLSFSPERLDEIQKMSKLQVVYAFTKYGKKLYDERMQDGKWDK